MKTITIDISECLYYLIPIVVIWIICYKSLLKDFGHYSDKTDKQIAGLLSVLMTGPASFIYFTVLYMILNSKIIIQL
jgi:hypothetical protein